MTDGILLPSNRSPRNLSTEYEQSITVESKKTPQVTAADRMGNSKQFLGTPKFFGPHEGALKIPRKIHRGVMQTSCRTCKVSVYLAGANGFPDFDAGLKSYGTFGKQVREDRSIPKFRQGFELLRRVEHEFERNGIEGRNPWTETTPMEFIEGAMFGVGVKDGVWPYGVVPNLRHPEKQVFGKFMSKADLNRFILEANKSKFTSIDKYGWTPHTGYLQSVEVFRSMVGDITFKGNRDHIDKSDVVLANLNAYRGDGDDGTFWEAFYTLHDTEKELVFITDQNTSFGEGLFGENVRNSGRPFNMMVSGDIEEAEESGRAKRFHSYDDAIAYILNKYQPQ